MQAPLQTKFDVNMSAALTFDPLGPGVPASPGEPCREHKGMKTCGLRDVTERKR